MDNVRRLIAAAAIIGAAAVLPMSSIACQDTAGGPSDSPVQYSAKSATPNGGQGDWPLKR